MLLARDTPSLREGLDRLYLAFNYPDSVPDPIHIVRRYDRPDDREVVGFCASALAFGRVSSVLRSIEQLVAVMGPRPAAYVRAFDRRRHGSALSGFVHRWTRGPDIVQLLSILRRMLERAGSIEEFFVRGYREPVEDVGPALDLFSASALGLVGPSGGGARRRAGVGYFFPRPSNGSGCKRLNLFLRWMVRRDDLDLGVWSRVPPSALVVPLDTHVIRVGRCLRLTRYVSPGWPMAVDITRALRRIDPQDPVKYDFALCHLGMMNACGFSRPAQDTDCPLRGRCRPRWRTPPPSGRPSAGR